MFKKQFLLFSLLLSSVSCTLVSHGSYSQEDRDLKETGGRTKEAEGEETSRQLNQTRKNRVTFLMSQGSLQM